MPVLAMRVVTATDHPNADALRVYQFEAPQAQLVVVANLEHAYVPGDVVAVATVGTCLLDGTQIRKSVLRGVASFGLAMGGTDREVGDDLSALHCPPEAQVGAHSEALFARWTSLELLHHVRRTLAERTVAERVPRIRYRAKVKLDGTNAGIHVLPNAFAVQSRTRMVTPQDDNYGFARWAAGCSVYLAALHGSMGRAVIYGEWCGAGIQKRTAIAAIDRKLLAVFAIQLGDPTSEVCRLVVEPSRLRELLPTHPDIVVLPWHGDVVELDYGDREQLEPAVVGINAMVAQVEARDPFVADALGVDGMGEGVVFYPVNAEFFDAEMSAAREGYTELMFKAKGDKHQVVRQKRPAQLDPEVVKSVAEFVALVVTDNRLEQALQESCWGQADLVKVGGFLKWLATDIHKEAGVELEAAQLEWKQVARSVNTAALGWFKAKACAV